MDDVTLKAELEKHSFFHRIQLNERVWTPSDPTRQPIVDVVLRALDRVDFRDKRVLDVGCRDGLFSLHAERAGASEVIGIDNDLSAGAVEVVLPYLKSGVKMEQMNLFELTADTFGRFDVVIFAGVLYHLRYPFWALRILRDVMNDGGQMVIETALWPKDEDRAILHCPVGDESPYEPTSCTFFNAKGLRDTLATFAFEVEHEERLSKARFWAQQRDLGAIAARVKARLVAAYQQRLRVLRRVNIPRAVFTCRAVPKRAHTPASRYWDGVHDLHTSGGKVDWRDDVTSTGQRPSET